MKNSSQKNFHWHVNDRLDLSKPSGEDRLAIIKLFEPDDDGPAIGLDDDRPDVSELSGVDGPAASDLFEDEDGLATSKLFETDDDGPARSKLFDLDEEFSVNYTLNLISLQIYRMDL